MDDGLRTPAEALTEPHNGQEPPQGQVIDLGSAPPPPPPGPPPEPPEAPKRRRKRKAKAKAKAKAKPKPPTPELEPPPVDLAEITLPPRLLGPMFKTVYHEAAMKLGEWWELDDDTSAKLGTFAERCLDRYLPQWLAGHFELWVFASTLVAVTLPRAMQTVAVRKAKGTLPDAQHHNGQDRDGQDPTSTVLDQGDSPPGSAGHNG